MPMYVMKASHAALSLGTDSGRWALYTAYNSRLPALALHS